MLEILGHIERDAVQYLSTGVIDKFKFDVLKMLTHELARPEVHYPTGAEHRLGVTRAERIEPSQQRDKLRRYFGKCEICVNI